MNSQQAQQGKITALYCRLSVDDGFDDRDSNSIVHQKDILTRYAKEHGFGNTACWVDDGVSGTLFGNSRPGLSTLLDEVRAGNVATILIKDSSRIGRDVLEVGLLKRTLEEHNTRLIAVNGDLDTAKGFDIMSVFRDVFNEWFVAETSRKIRDVFLAKAKNGRHSNSVAPYGYKPSTADKFVWDIDEPAAEVVRDIFKMCVEGIGPQYIAKELRRRGLKIPRAYKAERDGVELNYTFKYPDTDWDTSVITSILANREYTGTACLNKKTTKSYKDHRKYVKPEEEWICHENAHSAIVDRETFETVQRIRAGRRQVKRTYEKGALDDVLRCATCGGRLHGKRCTQKLCDGTSRQYCTYVCKNSRSYTEYATCTTHSIRRDDVEKAVLENLQAVLLLARTDERKFAERLNSASQKESQKALQRAKAEQAKATGRIAALDRIISRTYEDNVEGKISDERFATMLAGYEAEQSALKAKAAELEKLIGEATVQTTNIENFLNMVRKYTEVKELTIEIVHEFIERVEVSEAVYTPPRFSHWGRGKTQAVRVIYNYIGDVSAIIREE